MYDSKQQTYTKTEYDCVRAENERLKEFARPVIRQECWSIFEQDGLDIHDLAEKLGLIVPCTATEEDVDETIFRFSETLKESDDGRKNLTSEL